MLTIYAMAVANALLLAFLLATRQRHTNPVANRWLAAFLLALTGLMAEDVLDLAGQMTSPYLYTFGFSALFLLLIAPCLHFGVAGLTQVRFQFRPRHLLHFLPWLLHNVVLVACWWRIDVDRFTAVSPQTAWLFWLLESFSYVALVQNGVYVVIALRQLAAHPRNIQLFASATDRIDLHWLRWFIAGVSVLLLVWGAILFTTNNQWVNAYPLVLFSLFYYLGYFALNQPTIYPVSPHVAAELETVMDQRGTPKPTALLSPAEVDHWKSVLLHLMETQKPYTDSELTLPRLAGLLALSPHKLSYVINQGFSENFFQFVNRYRVEESKRLLTDPRKQHINILALGYEAGFNSKTAFNTAFRRTAGLSPSDFQKKHGALRSTS